MSNQRWPDRKGGAEWRGAFNPALAYAKNALVGYGGSTYRATEDIEAGVTPPSDSRWQIAARKGDDGASAFGTGLSFGGAWSNSGSWAADSLVTYEGKLYLSTDSVAAGQAPPDSNADWDELALGVTGETGATGPRGATGAVGVWRGQWSAGTDYDAADVVLHFGSLWLATQASTGAEHSPPDTSDGTSADWELLTAFSGSPGMMKWRGNWSSGASYTPGDMVLRDHQLYVANSASVNSGPPSEPWDPVQHSLPTLLDAASDPVWARTLRFVGATMDTSEAPTRVTVRVNRPTAQQVRQAVGASKTFRNLALKSGFGAAGGYAEPAVGMDIGGMVVMRGRVTGGDGNFAQLTDRVLWPSQTTRIPVARGDGGVAHVVISPTGALTAAGTTGEAIDLNGVMFPSGAAFGNSRSVVLEFVNGAGQDTDDPLQSVGDFVVGTFTISEPDTTTNYVRVSDDAEIEPGLDWHFQGNGTYEVTTGASEGQTGTVTVNRDGALRFASLAPDVTDPGIVKVTFNPGALSLEAQ